MQKGRGLLQNSFRALKLKPRQGGLKGPQLFSVIGFPPFFHSAMPQSRFRQTMRRGLPFIVRGRGSVFSVTTTRAVS